MNTPRPDLKHVLQALDLASASDEAFRAELTALTQRVAAEQGLALDPQRIAQAVQVVQLQTSLPVTKASAAPPALSWSDRPVDEMARQAAVMRVSTGWRGWLRRLYVSDQGHDTLFQKVWGYAVVGVATLNLISTLMTRGHGGGLSLGFSVAGMGMSWAGMLGCLMGCRYQEHQRIVVDEALHERIVSDPLARDYIQACRRSGLPDLLNGDLNVLRAHWMSQLRKMDAPLLCEAGEPGQVCP